MPFKKYVKKNSVIEIETDGGNFDEVDKPPNFFHVTTLDIVLLIYSIVIHIVDVALDINLAYHYFNKRSYTYFIWTVSFMLVPALIITIISLRMYVVDNDNSSVSRMAVQRRFLCILVLFLQLAPVMRYCDSLNYALRSRRAEKQGDRKNQRHYYKKMLNEDSDVALLRVFECYLESAPQQILQITILLVDATDATDATDGHLLQQCLSIGSSFVAMAWCIASYNRSIRFDQDNKNNISWTGTIVQFLWHLHVTISRILSICVVAALSPLWTGTSVAVHWLAMALWLAFIDNTSFCGSSRLIEFSFALSLGLVYVFNFISLREGSTRNYYLAYYPLCFVENIVAVVFWALLCNSTHRSSWYYYPLIVIPIASFLLGMAFLVTYYRYLHPNKYNSSKNIQERMYGIQNSHAANKFNTTTNVESRSEKSEVEDMTHNLEILLSQRNLELNHRGS